MSKDKPDRSYHSLDDVGRFGHQPLERRGYQPVAGVPIFEKNTVAGGYQPTTSQTNAPPATPPNQGSSGKK